MAFFPLFIDMEHQQAIIVGGGETAYRKAKQLLSFGCDLQVISRDISPKFLALAQEQNHPGKVLFHQGDFGPGMIPGDAKLVIGATDNREVNRQVSQEAQQLGIPVNIVDDKELCTFYFPSIFKEDEVVVGISSGGKNPVISRYLRERVEEVVPQGIGSINRELEVLRQKAMEELPYEQRREYLEIQLEQLLKGEADEN